MAMKQLEVHPTLLYMENKSGTSDILKNGLVAERGSEKTTMQLLITPGCF
jgi:hypothetical protein